MYNNISKKKILIFNEESEKAKMKIGDFDFSRNFLGESYSFETCIKVNVYERKEEITVGIGKVSLECEEHSWVIEVFKQYNPHTGGFINNETNSLFSNTSYFEQYNLYGEEEDRVSYSLSDQTINELDQKYFYHLSTLSAPEKGSAVLTFILKEKLEVEKQGYEIVIVAKSDQKNLIQFAFGQGITFWQV